MKIPAFSGKTRSPAAICCSSRAGSPTARLGNGPIGFPRGFKPALDRILRILNGFKFRFAI
jgi:hypothetical protein